MDELVLGGITTLLDDYASIDDSDMVVICYTFQTKTSAAQVTAALDLRKINRVLVEMPTVIGNTHYLDKSIPDPNKVIGKLVLMFFEQDSMSHTDSILSAVSGFPEDRCRIIRLICGTQDLFSQALNGVTPRALSSINAALLEQFMGAHTLKITTESGTKLNVELNSDKYRWISNRGLWQPGRQTILPAGEIATYPAKISGTLVADYAINTNTLSDIDVRLSRSPITVTIFNSQIIDYKCKNEELKSFLDRNFQINHSKRVGELGFGTNFGIKTAIARNSHVNERVPGIHLGFGQHNQDDELIGYNCPVHLDLICKGGKVWVDNSPIELDLENIVPSTNLHPKNVVDEDVFDGEVIDGDCCGLN